MCIYKQLKCEKHNDMILWKLYKIVRLKYNDNFNNETCSIAFVRKTMPLQIIELAMIRIRYIRYSSAIKHFQTRLYDVMTDGKFIIKA